MTLDDINSFKTKVRNEEAVNLPQEGASGLQALVDARPDRRVAVGYSRLRGNNYRLELRVQREGGHAHAYAQQIAKEAKGEARIAVLESLQIPSLRELFIGSRPAARTKRRPLHLGVSIGPREGGAGTLGCFVELKNQRVGILTAAHVLTKLSDEAKVKQPVFQPGSSDVSRLLGSYKVAELADWSVAVRDKPNEIDAAIAQLDPDVDHLGNQVPEGGAPKELHGKALKCGQEATDVALETVVAKIGRSTDYRTGKLSAIGLDGVPVFSTYLGNLSFDDVIEIEWESSTNSFSLPGDSGSVVFVAETREVIGLVFAGGALQSDRGRVGVTYACGVRTILEEFSVAFLK